VRLPPETVQSVIDTARRAGISDADALFVEKVNDSA
jgi:hypothetical protein